MSDSLQPHGLYNLPGSSVHRILQEILEWVAISSRGSSRIEHYTGSHIAGSHIAKRILNHLRHNDYLIKTITDQKIYKQ